VEGESKIIRNLKRKHYTPTSTCRYYWLIDLALTSTHHPVTIRDLFRRFRQPVRIVTTIVEKEDIFPLAHAGRKR
jgi:hypothetical protein